MTTHIDMDIELDRLKEIGFPDEVWKTVHQNVRRGTQGTTMETMRLYRPGGFRPDGNSDRLVRRLKFINANMAVGVVERCQTHKETTIHDATAFMYQGTRGLAVRLGIVK